MKHKRFFRSLALLLAALCLMSTAAFAVDGCATVTASALNMRASAGTSSAVVTCLPKGTVVLVTGESDGWYKVWYNGKSGYMSGDYLSLSETGTANFGTGTINANGVNVRSGASTSSGIVATLNRNTTLPITGVDNDWYQVSYNGSTAYVRSDLMDISAGSGSSSGSSSSSSGSSSDKTGTINASYVRLREGASTSSRILNTLNKGAAMTVTGTSGDWYAVSYNGTAGYVYKQYLTVEGESSSSSSSSSSTNEKGTINAYAVRLRQGASTSSKILYTLNKGAAMTVTGTSGDWYAVSYNGTAGYVYKQYLTLGESSSSSSSSSSGGSTVSPVDEDTGTIRGMYVRVRTGPSTSSSIITSLNTGAKLDVTGITGEWYQVKYNGQTGYVYKSYLVLGEQEISSGSTSSGSATDKGQQIVTEAKKYLGVPYVYGGTSPSGFDCSGLVYYVGRQLGYSLYRTASAQYRNGVYVDRSALQPGDLIIFYNSAMSAIGHIGIYVGDNQFIHASSGSGRVVISSLSQSYYNTHYYGARRIV